MPNPNTIVPMQSRRAGRPRRPRTELDDRIDALWLEYKRDGLIDQRNELVLHYSPLVKYVAGRVGAGLPPSIEVKDLIQYGMIGLHDAIEKFEPQRKLKFETYAITRISGAILDELRSDDWVPRSVRSKIRSVERATEALEKELHRTPTEDEIAERLSLTLHDLRAIYEQAALTSVGSLNEILGHSSDYGSASEASLGSRLADPRATRPGSDLEDQEIRRLLKAAIRELPERDRIVITLYYFEKLTLAEIGIVLEVTESRVCQLHTKACSALQAKMLAVQGDSLDI